ncbi:hypothetical protein J6590_049475 [Homalodisca vitripennis]|nr:hypothetical protein J6590_049475 [Homalodisca vitripennis]
MSESSEHLYAEYAGVYMQMYSSQLHLYKASARVSSLQEQLVWSRMHFDAEINKETTAMFVRQTLEHCNTTPHVCTEAARIDSGRSGGQTKAGNGDRRVENRQRKQACQPSVVNFTSPDCLSGVLL